MGDYMYEGDLGYKQKKLYIFSVFKLNSIGRLWFKLPKKHFHEPLGTRSCNNLFLYAEETIHILTHGNNVLLAPNK